MNKLRFFFLLLFSLLALSACTLAEDITPPPGYVSPTPAPDVGALYPANPPDLQGGAAIFAEKCAPCHGASGMGDGPKSAQLPVTVPTLGLVDIARGAIPAEWYTTVTRGRIEKMMPPFNSLNDQQRWDVVAYALSLSVKPAEVAQGAQVYAAACAECHGADGSGVQSAVLSDPSLITRLSKNDIYRFVSKGVAPGMPGFELTLDETSRRAVADYVASWSLGAPLEQAAVLNTPTPQPSATPEAQNTLTAEATPAAAASTPEAQNTLTAEASPTPSSPLLTLTGKVTNGSGGALPGGLKLTLHGVDHDASNGKFSEVITLEGQPAADGAFTFEKVEAPVGRAFYVTTTYQGSDYGSSAIFAEEGVTSYDLSLSVYDTTTDTAALAADQMHILLDFTTPNVMTVIEFYVISNNGTAAVISASEGGPVLNFSLPEGYSNLQFQDGALGDRYVQTPQGFADTQRVVPGSQKYQVAFAFDLPYAGGNFLSGPSAAVSIPVTLPVKAFSLLSPPGVKVKGEGLVDVGLQDMGGTSYQVYTAPGYQPGQSIALTVSGKVSGSADTTTNATGDNSRNILIGVGALGMALILAGGYLFWRDRRQEQEENILEEEPTLSEEEILDALIALEDQYKAGTISAESYQQRRADLKTQLEALHD